jgi:DNA repair protein RadC
LAASISLATTASSRYPVGRFGRQESDIRCAGLDPRYLGVSATGHLDRGSRPAQNEVNSADEEIALLAQLIGEEPGAASMALSKALLDKYGTLANIVRQFQQDQASAQDVPYPVERRLCAVARAVTRLLHREALEGPAISSPDILAGCLRNEMAGLPRETFRVLFLDAGNRLLADENMWEGTIDRVQIHPREVIRRAIETGATALIVAHNHPGGDPAPSRHDVAMTNKLIAACAVVELHVHDHIIVSRSGWFSMAEHGLITCTIAESLNTWGVHLNTDETVRLAAIG